MQIKGMWYKTKSQINLPSAILYIQRSNLQETLQKTGVQSFNQIDL